MKLCKDCKFYDSGWCGEDNYISPEYCIRPINSFVHGSIPLNEDPERERESTIEGHCGEEGKYYVPNKRALEGNKKKFLGLF